MRQMHLPVDCRRTSQHKQKNQSISQVLTICRGAPAIRNEDRCIRPEDIC